MNLKDTYAKPYILWVETNYRSTPEIVNDAADFYPTEPKQISEK